MEFAKGSGVDPQDLRPLNKLKLVAGSTLALTGKYSNFMCLRTFSKAYGLAGLRVGYAVAVPVSCVFWEKHCCLIMLMPGL